MRAERARPTCGLPRYTVHRPASRPIENRAVARRCRVRKSRKSVCLSPLASLTYIIYIKLFTHLDPRGSGLLFFMFIRPQPYTCLGIECTVTRADHAARTPLCTAKRFVRFVICGLHGLPCTVVPCTYGIERSICHGARVLPRTGASSPRPARDQDEVGGESSFASTASRCFIGHIKMPRGSTRRSAIHA